MEWYIERYGARCGICGSTTRRLNRDHWHKGEHEGKPRGVLCWRCNVWLPDWVDEDWLRAALAYLERGGRG
jgi:hypothetical protein